MQASPATQLTLALFESTALGLTLDGPDLCPAVLPAPASGPEPEQDEPAPPAPSFRLVGDRGLAQGWRARAADNLAAIRLLKRIEAERRPATAEEQAILARFTGFGASDLANGLFRRPGEAFRSGWEALGRELEDLVTQAELAGLARSTQYAHYTPEPLVRFLWRAVQRLGFTGGHVLEPGCGTGLFFALLPEALQGRVSLTGIEAEPLSARLARLLHPEACIRQEDLTRVAWPENVTLVIGNPPFSDRTVRTSDPAGRLGLALHDYVIARGIECLRPGGVAALVTSRWTLDKGDGAARAHIARTADLLAAIRLPEGALRAAAGTDTVVDLLFFRRRASGEAPSGITWDGLAEVVPAGDGEPALLVNRCLAERPWLVLGRHVRASGPFGPAYTCLGETDPTLEAALNGLLEQLPQGVCVIEPEPITARPLLPGLQVGTAAEGALVKEGSYLVGEGGALLQVTGGEARLVPVRRGQGTSGIPARHARIIRSLIPIRDAVRAILRAQAEDQPWGNAQTRLRLAYAGFVASFGPINLTTTSVIADPHGGEAHEVQRRPNLQPFLDDPDCWLMASIEDYSQETGQAGRGPIFSQQVINPPVEPVITSAADALAVTLEACGQVDLEHLAELLGRSREQVLAELGETVFQDPGTGTWLTADAYLSGAVRGKLASAEAAAARDPAYRRNVDALRRVQPEDLRPSEITARLGAPWIPAEVVEAFVAEVVGIRSRIRHTVEIASWSVQQKPFTGSATAATDWGTSRRHAGQLLEDALNQATPQIFDSWTEDGREHRELNGEATEAAKEKLRQLKAAFEAWVWTEPARTDRLVRLYNEGFNNLVPRHFDGSHLRLPGATSVIRCYPHQKRVIWRIIAAGSTYVAHSVGAGKTFSLAAAVMEQKRLGLITKAMLVVPGHCLAQAAREFLQLYPQARILVADESNFIAARRQRFLARAATSGWDCIIITHAAFKLIPAPAAFERELVGEQLELYEDLLTRAEGDDRLTRKRLERLKEGLEGRLEALSGRKDDLLSLAELGVDQLLVDEAQEFRKLAFATNMSGLKGVDPDGSQRAWDLHVKSRWIARSQPSRALIMASGTPITNTLGEMFSLQRFMAPQLLAERGVQAFDAWAASFGDTRSELELQPSGRYRPVTRFAEFVNVPELVAMFRAIADVVSKEELRQQLTLPAVKGGGRRITTAEASPGFRAYQRELDARIRAIEARKDPPRKGEDILLSVIGDGRHAAIDLRLVNPEAPNEPGSKLNLLIANVHRIWRDTAQDRYTRADGVPYARPGAGQLVFSDLGTLSVEESRGFSAYRWIRDELVRLGVPAGEIAFMQDHRRSEAKQRLFAAFDAGRVRILIGSSPTMGTGVNVQRRLKALHHLDVPWLPSEIEQREGRIERQGNQNPEIEIHAYATLGSMDAPLWQANERKARFIAAALSGDRTLRRLEDAGSQADQYALAKAIASGDERLLRKAGLEAELGRLRRLRAAQLDEQHAIRREIALAKDAVNHAERRVLEITEDLARRQVTRGEAFRMEVESRSYIERRVAGEALLRVFRRLEQGRVAGEWPTAKLGGFELVIHARRLGKEIRCELVMRRTSLEQEIGVGPELTPLGLVARLEHQLERFEVELAETRQQLAEARTRLADYQPRLGEGFALAGELAVKEQELSAIEASLAGEGEGRAEAA